MGWDYRAQPLTPLSAPPHIRTRLGFGQQRGRFFSNPIPSANGTVRRTGPVYITAIPLYPISTAFALLPLLWSIGALRRWRRRREGRCVTCGYNLTSNTTGVCPECGTQVEQPLRADNRGGQKPGRNG